MILYLNLVYKLEFMEECLLFSIGIRVFVVSIIYLWLVYFLFVIIKPEKLISSGISILLLIPLDALINRIVTDIIGAAFILRFGILFHICNISRGRFRIFYCIQTKIQKIIAIVKST